MFLVVLPVGVRIVAVLVMLSFWNASEDKGQIFVRQNLFYSESGIYGLSRNLPRFLEISPNPIFNDLVGCV